MIDQDYAGFMRRTPHRFQDSRAQNSPYDHSCRCCLMTQNYRIHQPYWWRWLNPRKKYRG